MVTLKQIKQYGARPRSTWPGKQPQVGAAVAVAAVDSPGSADVARAAVGSGPRSTW